MIKLTKINSSKELVPTLVIVPGGPGLSSLTLRSLDCLSRSFNLCYVDFPGCNSNSYDGKKSFEKLSEQLLTEIKKLNGEVYVLGHSYGGLFASKLALELKCAGLICLSTPLSLETLKSATGNYEKHKTDELKNAEENWIEEKTNQSFAGWLSSYGLLYFDKHTLKDGKKLLENDKVCAQFFLDNRSDTSPFGNLIGELNKLEVKKLFVIGGNDELLSHDLLQDDAHKGGFKFSIIKNASHFVGFDQPEAVAGLIEKFIATEKGKL